MISMQEDREISETNLNQSVYENKHFVLVLLEINLSEYLDQM